MTRLKYRAQSTIQSTPYTPAAMVTVNMHPQFHMLDGKILKKVAQKVGTFRPDNYVYFKFSKNLVFHPDAWIMCLNTVDKNVEELLQTMLSCDPVTIMYKS